MHDGDRAGVAWLTVAATTMVCLYFLAFLSMPFWRDWVDPPQPEPGIVWLHETAGAPTDHARQERADEILRAMRAAVAGGQWHAIERAARQAAAFTANGGRDPAVAQIADAWKVHQSGGHADLFDVERVG